MRVACRVCCGLTSVICPLDLITHRDRNGALLHGRYRNFSALLGPETAQLSTPLGPDTARHTARPRTAQHTARNTFGSQQMLSVHYVALAWEPETAQCNARHLFGDSETAQQTLWPDRRARYQLSTSCDLLSES